MNQMFPRAVLAGVVLPLFLSACGAGSSPSAASNKPAEAVVTTLDVPAGKYVVDRNHADLRFEVSHFGLSNYVARFEGYSLEIDLNPEDLSQSSVVVVVDPTSIQTGYVGDYKATHKDSEFDSWEEDLAQSPRFFNASKHPEVRFESTQVQPVAGGLKVTGDLAMLGQTHPVVLNVEIVGSKASHPMTKKGAFGVSASGGFERSPFGMDFLVKQGFLGDLVSVHFEGEFQQAN